MILGSADQSMPIAHSRNDPFRKKRVSIDIGYDLYA